ncbi:unnamed protein product [Urochloa decumbens]|uniref:F-box domain-containing protein n=1 Tax=Urochloa decumbens TaxID=240449 RepID=A0ABC8XR89_9POAL
MVTTARDLPDDVLAAVLRRLAPRGVAASRCVCRSWRDAIDARRLLRADLLPLSVGGIFMEYCALYSPEFLSRPSAAAAPISAGLDFMPSVRRVLSHCGGLLLCERYGHERYYVVANPATRQFARLPPPTPPPPQPSSASGVIVEACFDKDAAACLVYDPTASPHYEVFLVPLLRVLAEKHEARLRLHPHPEPLRSEWPPLSCTMRVFSSATRRWREQTFLRVGEAAGTLAAMEPSYWWDMPGRNAYWRRALYVRCRGDRFITRISLSDAKYQIVNTPRDKTYLSFLGRSEKGVYCATSDGFHELSIWHLSESYGGQMEWVLKHHVNLMAFSRKLHALEDYHKQNRGPWILQDINYRKCSHKADDYVAVEEAEFEWDSDNDDVLDTSDMAEGNYTGYTGVLGFHPYKEVIFLNASLRRGVAYHWNTSKFQDLGNIWPKDYAELAGEWADLEMSFIYTPCWLEEFYGNNFEDQK